MGIIRYQEPQIAVDIADLVIGDTIIKRKCYFESLLYTQINQGPTPSLFGGIGGNSPERVAVVVTVKHFAKNADGTYGEALEGKNGFVPYQKRLLADDTTLVDSTTGEILCSASQYTAEAVSEGGVLFGKDFMYENEFFRRMAKTQAVIVDDLIIAKIQSASARGIFDQP